METGSDNGNMLKPAPMHAGLTMEQAQAVEDDKAASYASYALWSNFRMHMWQADSD